MTATKRDTTKEKIEKKGLVFKDIEDVISIGALLRPVISKAVSQVKTPELDSLLEVLIDCEQALASSKVRFEERFYRTQELLKSTYSYGATFRFISSKIEETWKAVPSPTVKELSAVSLILGSILEETQAALSSRAKKRKSA